jgi:hypothetical protein
MTNHPQVLAFDHIADGGLPTLRHAVPDGDCRSLKGNQP